jgi:hypothetical protein
MIFFCRRINVKLASFFLIILLLAISPVQYVHAAPIFGTLGTASTFPGNNDVAIKANGSNVYVAYTDSTQNIGVSFSANNGTIFSGPTLICGGSCAAGTDQKPAIAVSGQYLYVAWLDGDGNIAIARSDDSGASFVGVAPFELEITGSQQSGPHIAVSGNSVYIQWIDDNGKVVFDASNNNGVAWNGIQVLSTTSNIFDPQLAAAGTNAYVTWEDKSVDGSGDINATVLTSSGTVVGANNNLSNTPGQASAKPQIAANATNVYVVWQESGKDVFFAKSINDGTSFGSGTNLSNSGGTADNPQIAANATKVYVVWQDTVTGTGTNEILFKASSNSGTTFGSAINVSGTPGESVFPKVALSGNNVFVVWQDKTIDSTGDILFKASSDSGTTFGGLKKLNSNINTIKDDTDRISASSKNISTVWSDTSDFANYVSATYSPIEVQFSASQYSLNSTATITVTDPSANTNSATLQMVSIGVTSTTDPIGIAALTLTETGANTGVFSGTITFISSGSTSGTTLLASPNDIITATYSGQSSIASIVPITIAFDSPAGYDRGAIAHITVTDPNEHATGVGVPLQKITVHLTSIANPAGVNIELTETLLDSNIFGGATSATNSLIFMDTNNLYPSSGKVTITQTNTGANAASNAIDTITETITSTTTPGGITMNLNETGVNTGIFTGVLTLGSSTIDHVAITVVPGDILTVTRGLAIENGLITTNPNKSVNALLVTADPTVDTVTASYAGVTKSVPVSRLFDPGGSGGGLLRPGLILNVLAAAHSGSSNVSPSFDLSSFAGVQGALPDSIRQQVLNQDPFKPISPSHDTSFNFPFYIGDNGYPLAHYTNTISPNAVKVGDPVTVKLNIPASGLVHVALYTNIRGTENDVYHSDTYIIYDKGQPLQVVDPHGFFAPHTGFDLTTSGVNNAILFKITFAKPMDKSDIDLRAWNDHQASSETKILDAWQVEPQSQTSQSQTTPLVTTPTENVTPNQSVVPSTSSPEATQTASPTILMPSIEDWGGYSPHPISDSELLSDMGINGNHIPSWVMTTTKFVVNGDITAEDFVNIVKYLASQGIIK